MTAKKVIVAEPRNNYEDMNITFNFDAGTYMVASRDKYGKIEKTQNDSLSYKVGKNGDTCIKLPARLTIKINRDWLPRRLDLDDNKAYFPAHEKFAIVDQ